MFFAWMHSRAAHQGGSAITLADDGHTLLLCQAAESIKQQDFILELTNPLGVGVLDRRSHSPKTTKSVVLRRKTLQTFSLSN